MKRCNIFSVRFKDHNKALEIAKGCSALWNVLNYKRRQTFFDGKMEWDSRDEYKSFAPSIGSCTAQQIIRKNDQAWRAFLGLLKLKGEGKLPPHIKKVSPPGYWKDRNKNEVIPRMLIRNNRYKIKNRTIKLPKKIRGRIFGNLKWRGKQGTIELQYDTDRQKWYAHMPVETQAFSQPIGQNTAYVDVGVKYPLVAVLEGVERPIAYKGAPMLSDWWYWNHQIAKHQRELATVNKKKTSKRLSKLYRTRRVRHRQAVNEIARDFIERCNNKGIREIVLGDLTGIRNNGNMGKKTNAMVNNYWSHKYFVERVQYTAENYGIITRLVDERGTSSRCPRCGSEKKIRRGRLYKCKNCKLEAHRDAVGAINISVAHPSGAGHNNWAMARPEIVNNNLKGTPLL